MSSGAGAASVSLSTPCLYLERLRCSLRSSLQCSWLLWFLKAVAVPVVSFDVSLLLQGKPYCQESQVSANYIVFFCPGVNL